MKIWDVYMTEPSSVTIYTKEEVNIGVPIKLELEVVPTHLIRQPIKGAIPCYKCHVESMKGSISNTSEFVVEEEKQLDELLQLPKTVNRFTGLEISDS